jgi:hypothetical protein
MASAFDKIAKKVSDTPKSKDKATAEVNPEIQTKVDQFVANKAELKRLEAEQKTIEETIIGHVRPQQDEMAYCGSFTKSLAVPGVNTAVTYVTMDKFSVPQDEAALDEIKKLVGKRFDDMFETRRSITMKKTAIEDEITINKIATACEKAGLNVGDIFDVGDKVTAKDNLDRKQYDLTKKQLDVFRTLVRQTKPALK